MQYKNINKRDYVGKHQKKWTPKKNHYIPNDYPPPFVIGQMFKTVVWEKTYIFTITSVSKVAQYKTFVYGVDVETWEEEIEIDIWQSMQKVNNMSTRTIITTTSNNTPIYNNIVANNIWQAQKSMAQYYAWNSVITEPKHIHNMKSNGTIAHGALISMNKEEMEESDYAIFLLQGNMIQVIEE